MPITWPLAPKQHAYTAHPRVAGWRSGWRKEGGALQNRDREDLSGIVCHHMAPPQVASHNHAFQAGEADGGAGEAERQPGDAQQGAGAGAQQEGETAAGSTVVRTSVGTCLRLLPSCKGHFQL